MSKTIVALNKPLNYSAVLLCVHWVGGSAFAFRRLATLLATQGVLVYGVSLSLPVTSCADNANNNNNNNNNNNKSTRPVSAQEAAQLVFHALQSLSPSEFNPLGRPLLLLGHSYGAIVAYELCKLLSPLAWPVHRLIVSCVRAPRDLAQYNLTHAARANHLKSDKDLVNEIIRIDGLPAGVDPQFIWMSLQTIRDDFRAFETYSDTAQSTSLSVPIVCVSAENDRFVPASETRGWSSVAVSSEKKYVEHVLSGATHFYISDEKQLRALQDIVLHALLF